MSRKSPPVLGTFRSLPLRNWPDQDRQFWNEITGTRDLFDLERPRLFGNALTIKKVKMGYGFWLSFVSSKCARLLNHHPSDRLKGEHVKRYVDSMEILSPFTALTRVTDLITLGKLMDPAPNIAELRDIRLRLKRIANEIGPSEIEPISTTKILKAGLDHFWQAQSFNFYSKHVQAIEMRDGLMVAFLATRPLRRSNFTNLEIGRSLLKLAVGYKIVLDRSETKNGRSLEMSLPEKLVAPLDIYISECRPVLLKKKRSNRLWIGVTGDDLASAAVSLRVATTTERLLGNAFGVHAFRHCAATTIAQEEPELIDAASMLLGHNNVLTTRRHYNRSQNSTASRRYQDTIVKLREKLRTKHG